MTKNKLEQDTLSWTTTAGNELWDKFLLRWPLEKLSQMTLHEYSQAGDSDCFTFGWLEKTTENLGSIWGGSAFKFGIYSRKDQSDKHDGSGKSYTTQYGWYSKYGTTPDEAFERVRTIIVEVANAARDGDLNAIEGLELGSAIKWKIAFLYQDRAAPKILPVYKAEFLAAYLEQTSRASLSQLQEMAMGKRGDLDVLAFGRNIWEQAEAKLAALILTPEEALVFFRGNPDRFQPIKDPTKYIAGFVTAEGREIAVSLNQKLAKLWLEPGSWLDAAGSQVDDVVVYSEDQPRSSNLDSNAPHLGKGNPAIFLTVPTHAALVALCDAYDNTDFSESGPMPNAPTLSFSILKPLNQILFGPPGTGKTYATIDEALAILDPEFLKSNFTNRAALKAHFDALVQKGKIRFVTFHQSFSYEDFVEGLRAYNDEIGTLRYEVVDGVFKSICEAAAAKVTQQAEAPINLSNRRIWKMSLGDSQGDESYLFDECIAQGYVLLGYGETRDFSGCTDADMVRKRFSESGVELGKNDYAITSVNIFVNKVAVGDLVVVTDGNLKFRAIGEITGDYKLMDRVGQGDHYGQSRAVKWLRVYAPSLPYDQLMSNRFSQMTLYELRSGSIDMDKLGGLLDSQPVAQSAASAIGNLFKVGEKFNSNYVVQRATDDVLEILKPNGKKLPLGMSMLSELADLVHSGRISIEDIRDKLVFEKLPDTQLEPYLVNGYNNILPALVSRLLEGGPVSHASGASSQANSARVLIIDEINRGNVSRVFGELITLIEPSKRQGAAEALEVTLPYSKSRFSIPGNVYIIGTMNTADRSLAGLDIALRRRFTFKEMPPRPDLLDEISISSVNIGQLLRTMNERIEVLLDRDHCLGHAYFIPLKDKPSLENLAFIFRQQILPLLQEYFFEDWERIAWVLNNQPFVQKVAGNLANLFSADAASNLQNSDRRWRINEDAFTNIESYRGILGASA